MRIRTYLVGALVISVGLVLPLPGHSTPWANAAPGGQEWFIAQSGTGSFGSGTSCAAPDVVGADDTAIRTVLDAVTADDTVTICDGVYDITQTLTIDDSIAIQGESARSSILDGGGSVQIMRVLDDTLDVTDPAEVHLLATDLTFRNGNAGMSGADSCNAQAQCGGAIYVEDESDLTVRRALFEDNRANFIGGAIGNSGEGNYTGGVIRIEDSTFYQNTSNIDGGAIGVGFTGGPLLTVVNSTFVENRALSRHGGAISESFGGGTITASTFLDNQGPDGDAVRGSFTVTGSVFAGPVTADMCSSGTIDNTSVSTGAGCGSAVVVTLDSLNLRGLGYWGGPTPTVWIGPGSTAIDANTGTCQALDQRGATRSAAPCDAGAYERRGATDEGTAGTLDYTSPILVDDTTIPLSSPTPSPAVSGRTIGYLSLSTSVCAVDAISGEITPAIAGTCEIQWYLAPTLSADGAAADDTVTVTRAAQEPLVIDPVLGPVAYGTSVTLTTTGGSGDGAVVFSAGASTGCYVPWWFDPTLVAVVDATGTCVVTATKSATASYDSVTSAPLTITLTKGPQSSLAIDAPSSLAIGYSTSLSTSGGSTGGSVTYGASPASVCEVTGSTLRMLRSGSCLVTATMAGDSNYLDVSAPAATVESTSPPPPDPTKMPSAPQQVSATLTGASVDVTWTAPDRSGPFPISTYQVVSTPSGGSCLVLAPSLSCTVSRLIPGRSYSFRVRALNGIGWGAYSEASNTVTVPRKPDRSIVITGARAGRLVVVTGSMTGPASELRPWIRLRGAADFTRGKARIQVDPDGSFTWSRPSKRSLRVYVATEDGSITSNVVRVGAR